MAPPRLLPGHRKRLLLAAAQLPRGTLATSPKPAKASGGRPSSPESAKDRPEPRLVRRMARQSINALLTGTVSPRVSDAGTAASLQCGGCSLWMHGSRRRLDPCEIDVPGVRAGAGDGRRRRCRRHGRTQIRSDGRRLEARRCSSGRSRRRAGERAAAGEAGARHPGLGQDLEPRCGPS